MSLLYGCVEEGDMNVFRIGVFVVCFCGIVGCATPCTPKLVAAKIPHPPPISRPILEVGKVNKNSNDADVVKAYRVSLEQLINYCVSLEQVVKVYADMGKE